MEKFGLIGYPLGHSFSKGYLNDKFHAEGIDAEYFNFEIESIDLLNEVIHKNPTLRGLNVTRPYKEAIIPFLDELNEMAAEVGAVNVVKFTFRNGDLILKGYNSDVIGFMQSIESHLQPHHNQALLLGTGGAAKAVDYALRKLGLTTKYVSRNPSLNQLSYEELTATTLTEYTVIINCTPIGMYPHCNEAPPIPYELLSKRHLLYDLIYNPDETEFMRRGAKQGAKCLNGLEMLLLQADAAWDIWEERII